MIGIGVDSGDLSFPDMEKLAGAYGYPYIKAEHNSELAKAVEQTLAVERPGDLRDLCIHGSEL